MRHKILLVALAFSVLCGASACSSPPEVTAPDVGKLEMQKSQLYVPVAPLTVQVTRVAPTMYYVDGPVVVDLSKAVISAADVSLAPAKNCSKPQRIGLANRRCDHSLLSVIHLLVWSTSGHRLLHIDPGLC